MERSTAEKIVETAAGMHLTISAAESCTGGLVCSGIVSVPGASDVFNMGLVTYSNEAKENLLGVRHDTLEAYGAVSSQTALEMASGCAKKAASDYAVSTTGIAGPGGGSPEKPVGLVYIGCCARGSLSSEKCIFRGNRSQIRDAAANEALRYLYEKMTGESL